MSIDFPANPTIGQVYNPNGKPFIWTGVKWAAQSVGGGGGGGGGDTLGTVSGNDLDLSTGTFFVVTAADQTLSFSNPPDVHSFKISVTGGAGTTINYPSSVEFPGSSPPSAPANGETDTLEFYTLNGGITYYGYKLTGGSLAPFILAPNIAVEGYPDEIGETPQLSTSTFSVFDAADIHESTDWQIEATANNTVVYESLDDTTNKTSIAVPSGNLVANTEYIFRARHKGTTYGLSSYGELTANTVAAFAPDTLGQAYGGGYYIGTTAANGTCYYLIVAPNATGCACCQWKTTGTATAGTSSCTDGYSNTYGPMDNSTHPAGNWTATRTIGGFSDWYLPARDELNTLYVNDAGDSNINLPAGEGFAGSYYWSSTESSAASACFQLFTNGILFRSNLLSNSYRVRAVRREPI